MSRLHARRSRRQSAQGRRGDGFTSPGDTEVKLASKGNSKLDIPMRRIRVKRDKMAPIRFAELAGSMLFVR